MNPRDLDRLLTDLRAGRVSVERATRRLRTLPFEAVGDALLDTHRAIRCGSPETVYCEGKPPALVARLARASLARGLDFLGTRADRRAFAAVRRAVKGARFHAEARIITARSGPAPAPAGRVAVVSAGASDARVAEEAAATAEFLGSRVLRVRDVGVAGLHRLLARLDEIQEARAIVVAAGMEGALASVVGGLVAAPVVAVPTSVGYGAHLKGLTPLLSMMSSCAPNVCVVNIDNGFGAGYLAAMINRGATTESRRPESGTRNQGPETRAPKPGAMSRKAARKSLRGAR